MDQPLRSPFKYPYLHHWEGLKVVKTQCIEKQVYYQIPISPPLGRAEGGKDPVY
jgi:hypothetical protein